MTIDHKASTQHHCASLLVMVFVNIIYVVLWDCLFLSSPMTAYVIRHSREYIQDFGRLRLMPPILSAHGTSISTMETTTTTLSPTKIRLGWCVAERDDVRPR